MLLWILFAFIQFLQSIFNSCASYNDFGNVFFNSQLVYKILLFFCTFFSAFFCTSRHKPSSLPELLNMLLYWLSPSVYLPSSNYNWGLWFLPCGKIVVFILFFFVFFLLWFLYCFWIAIHIIWNILTIKVSNYLLFI